VLFASLPDEEQEVALAQMRALVKKKHGEGD
jgi:hypothetical protein